MKSLTIIAVVFIGVFARPVFAADVGVSVSVGQPGFYGRIDIGDYPYPQPQIIYSQPKIIKRVYIEREPIYLRVPPGHAKNWSKHCYKYNACDERVYFVQDNWYKQEYVPRYQEQHREHQDDYRYDERRDDSEVRDSDHGNKSKNHGNKSKKHSDNSHGNGRNK